MYTGSLRLGIALVLALVAACAPTPRPADRPAAADAHAPAAATDRPVARTSPRSPALNIPADRRAKLEADLAAAQAAYDADPTSEDAAIWLGRRLAYLGRWDDAIAAFSRGLRDHPDSFKLLRHRGHRYITIRDFDSAIADLSRAAELTRGVRDQIEPDGAPNRLNKPRSTTHSNIYYHLGLAHYLKDEFEPALAAYQRCLDYSLVNDDMLVATAQWLYLTNRRLGRERDAAAVLTMVRPNMDIIENGAYHRLLLMAKGSLTPEEVLAAPGDGAIDDATAGYGVGAWYFLSGDRPRALETWQRVLKSDNAAAFGFIAAEAELARLREPR